MSSPGAHALVLGSSPAARAASDTRRDECLAVLEEHSKSFALAGRLLTPEARRDAAALYAWCRYVDDRIDLSPPGQEQARLAELERELASVYAGEAQPSVVLAAFQEVVRERGIPRAYAEELLAGMRMDAEAVRYESLDDLLLYCHRVAGVVGLMMCHVLGLSDARALRHAAHLGIGMQLTNVCRDVLEDWGRGRLYLPRQVLEEAGGGDWQAAPPGALSGDVRKSIARAVERLLGLARQYYASGERGLSALDTRSAFAVRTAGLVYSEIGREIARRRYDVLAGRAVVPRWKKVVLAVRAALTTLAELPRRALSQYAALPSLPQRRFPDDVLPV